jgi:hypothetical protein
VRIGRRRRRTVVVVVVVVVIVVVVVVVVVAENRGVSYIAWKAAAVRPLSCSALLLCCVPARRVVESQGRVRCF